MSLRSKLLTLFGILAVAPLCALGVFDYFRSMRAVEGLLATQTAVVAERIARQARERLALLQGDLGLLANNDDTRRFLATGRDREQAEQFLTSALALVTARGVSLVFRDTAHRELLRLDGRRPDTTNDGPIAALLGDSPTHPFLLPITDSTGRAIGTMTATLRIDQLIPPSALDEHVGINGYSVVVDRKARRVLADPARPGEPERGHMVIDDSVQSASGATVGAMNYVEDDTARVGAIAPVGDDGLAVLSSASLPEFSAPLAAQRGTNLVLALLATMAVAIAFLVLARRVTMPLESLTIAADEIGRGNFEPALPTASGNDEVARLSAAIGRMSAQISDMLRQLESSRQMAAVGSFASQIAHEIRNPLTSIKLNLQSIQRDITRDGRDTADRRPLEICLSEIQRLDGVVRGVLQLAQSRAPAVARVSVHAELRAAAELMARQLSAQGVSMEVACHAPRDAVLGDAGELRGAVLNLLVNAADALPAGGRVRIATGQGDGARPTIRVIVSDSGEGVPAAARESIFEPFVTSKHNGSGLGLALASRDVEKQHGTLTLGDGRGELGGATFIIELPLAPAGAP